MWANPKTTILNIKRCFISTQLQHCKNLISVDRLKNILSSLLTYFLSFLFFWIIPYALERFPTVYKSTSRDVDNSRNLKLFRLNPSILHLKLHFWKVKNISDTFDQLNHVYREIILKSDDFLQYYYSYRNNVIKFHFIWYKFQHN